MTTEEKTASQLQASAERRLKSLRKRTNAALLELDDKNSERFQKLAAHAKFAKYKAFEKQRDKLMRALPETAVRIMAISSPAFCKGMTEDEMMIAAGLKEKPAAVQAPAQAPPQGTAKK